MDANLHSCECADEEDYIDMEVSSHSHPNLFCHSFTSPPHPREFEFQMSSGSLERDSTTSPADELFYKGNLLPLHLPPRLQMVEKLLESSSNSAAYECKAVHALDDIYSTPLATSTITSPAANTPFESCNISPSESCQISRELNPAEYFYQYSTEESSFICDNPKKSWTTKLKLIKHSSLGLKLKASRAYIKSLFSKSGCSNDPKIGEGSVAKGKLCSSKYFEVAKSDSFGKIHGRCQRPSTSTMGFDKEKCKEDNGAPHRRSFSVVTKRYSTAHSSSSSSSSGSSCSSYFNLGSSNGLLCETRFLKRSSSANSEIEISIQGAIAHCKRSQQLFRSRNTASEVGFCSFPGSRIAVCDDQYRTRY